MYFRFLVIILMFMRICCCLNWIHFFLLTNDGPGMDKRDEHCSKTKHGDDGMRKGIKNGVTSDDFRTLKPP